MTSNTGCFAGWIRRPGRFASSAPRRIALAACKAGAFNDVLYYRLNTVCVDVDVVSSRGLSLRKNSSQTRAGSRLPP